MSKKKRLIGLILILQGTVVGAYCVRTGVHPGSSIVTSAMRTVSPQELMQNVRIAVHYGSPVFRP